jgi:hypothetical protein
LCELTPPCVLAESDDELEEPVIIYLTMYVYVEKPPIPGKKGKLSDSNKYVQKGPFKLKSMENYSTFLVKISAALPCPVFNIVQEKMTWKCQTPQNSPLLPLRKELGYSAMLEMIKAKWVSGHFAKLLISQCCEERSQQVVEQYDGPYQLFRRLDRWWHHHNPHL